jgi:hypothetical protein
MDGQDGEVTDDPGAERPIAVDMRVRVQSSQLAEGRGLVVEDFGSTAGQAVSIGDHHIAEPARRWAVLLDSGGLVFVNSDGLVAE